MAQVNIEITDILDDCDKYDAEQMLEWLDEHYNKMLVEYMADTNNSITLPTEHSIQDEVWNEEILKLLKNRMGLTYEEEQTILKIAKKFI